jgi:murein peptide amidase A
MKEMNNSIKREGSIKHKPRVFGRTVLGAPLELFGRGRTGNSCLVMAGQHGTEPEGTVLLSSVLRSIPEKDLNCYVITSLNPDGLSRGKILNTHCYASVFKV